jgi:hypothetical protein
VWCASGKVAAIGAIGRSWLRVAVIRAAVTVDTRPRTDLSPLEVMWLGSSAAASLRWPPVVTPGHLARACFADAEPFPATAAWRGRRGGEGGQVVIALPPGLVRRCAG